MLDPAPVISPVESLPGFFISTGYSGHGFGIGPGAGRLMAELVMGTPTVVDPAPYHFSRFFEGSKIEAIAGVWLRSLQGVTNLPFIEASADLYNTLSAGAVLAAVRGFA